MIDLEGLPEEVKMILLLEKSYGHTGFLYDLDSNEEVMDKYRYISWLIRKLEEGNAKELEEQLIGMLAAGILTAETAAFFLSGECQTCKNAAKRLESWLEQRSIREWADYCSVFYRNAYHRIRDLLKDRESVIKLRELVDRKYASYYGKDVNEHSWFQGKCAVYTVITGDYDVLQEPEIINDNWDYYLFTDHPEKFSSKVWKIVPLENEQGLSPILLQKKVKFLPWEYLRAYDYTIYLDGKLRITGDLKEYIHLNAKNQSMLCLLHPTRQTLDEEARAIKILNRGNSELICLQIEHYRQTGYDNQRILTDNCCLIRSHKDPLLKKVMDDWWREVNEWSTRDQLSLGFCCWKNNYLYDISRECVLRNVYFMTMQHEKG